MKRAKLSGGTIQDSRWGSSDDDEDEKGAGDGGDGSTVPLMPIASHSTADRPTSQGYVEKMAVKQVCLHQRSASSAVASWVMKRR